MFDDHGLEQEYTAWFHSTHLPLDLAWSLHQLLVVLIALANHAGGGGGSAGRLPWPALLASAGAAAVSLLAWGHEKFYVRHRTAIIATLQLYRTAVFYLFAMPRSEIEGGPELTLNAFAASLLLESLAAANSSLGYQLPFVHHCWSAAVMAGFAIATNAGRCARACAAPGPHSARFAELAQRVQSVAALLPLPPHLPDRRALGQEQACWTLRSALQLGPGLLLPTVALAAADEAWRGQFLARRTGIQTLGWRRELPLRLAQNLPLAAAAALLSWHAARAGSMLLYGPAPL